MRGVVRLIEGLSSGDPTATYVLIFTVVGTVAIVLATGIIRRSRKRSP